MSSVKKFILTIFKYLFFDIHFSLAPRKKKSKKKGGSEDPKSPTEFSQNKGRTLSPFQKRRAMKLQQEQSFSSTDDEDDDEGGRGRLSPRAGGGSSHTFPGARNGKGSRSRSRSPLRAKQQMTSAMNTSQSPDGSFVSPVLFVLC